MATKLFVKILDESAKLPTRGSEQSAGYDLYSTQDQIIHANGKGLIKTGIAVKIPNGYYGRIAPRSGMSWKNHTDIGAGVIDADYRGELGIVLFNHSKQDLLIHKHDRVAQLIIEKIATPDIIQVDELDNTNRGENGYGSTGS